MTALTTLERLRDDLVSLYGEDQVSLLAMMAGRDRVSSMLKGGRSKLNNNFSFGKSDPNEPGAVADYWLTFSELLDRLDPKGKQSRAVRARLIVFAYTLWENVYRPSISQECNVDSVDSDEFGDLRLYRNAVLHNKGRLDRNTKRLTVFGKGDVVDPNADQLREVFKQLVSALNDIGLRYYGVNPCFEWGRRLHS